MWILDPQKYGNPDWKKDSGIRGFRLEVVERMIGDIKQIVDGMDIPESQKDRMLHFLIIERPYPIGYLPLHLQILTALTLTSLR